MLPLSTKIKIEVEATVKEDAPIPIDTKRALMDALGTGIVGREIELEVWLVVLPGRFPW